MSFLADFCVDLRTQTRVKTTTNGYGNKNHCLSKKKKRCYIKIQIVKKNTEVINICINEEKKHQITPTLSFDHQSTLIYANMDYTLIVNLISVL